MGRPATVGRVCESADIERLLSAPGRTRSAHFAVQHLALPLVARRFVPKALPAEPESTELSTVLAPICPQPVDDLPVGQWLACIVPKRHARRAVTRSLLKRQIRQAFTRHAATLPAGQWLVRLRAGFPVATFPSAASQALARAAWDELDQLLARLQSAG